MLFVIKTNCTLATLTHPRFLNNRRLENLVFVSQHSTKKLFGLNDDFFQLQKNLNKIGGSCVVFFCEKWAFF